MSELPPGYRLHPMPPQPTLGPDMRALILYEANKKEAVVAYLLAFFAGWLGAHNFYLKRTGVGIAQLILTLTVVGIFVTFIWVVIEWFLIHGWVRNQNNLLASQLGA
jgi:TM2 domain-containing membrane protein YozV